MDKHKEVTVTDMVGLKRGINVGKSMINIFVFWEFFKFYFFNFIIFTFTTWIDHKEEKPNHQRRFISLI